MSGKILRMPEISKRSGLSRSMIYEKLKVGGRYFDPDFPRPVKIGARAIGFREDELREWQANRERV